MVVYEPSAPPYAGAPDGNIIDAENVDGACRFHTAGYVSCFAIWDNAKDERLPPSPRGQKRECCGQSPYSASPLFYHLDQKLTILLERTYIYIKTLILLGRAGQEPYGSFRVLAGRPHWPCE